MSITWKCLEKGAAAVVVVFVPMFRTNFDQRWINGRCRQPLKWDDIGRSDCWDSHSIKSFWTIKRLYVTWANNFWNSCIKKWNMYQRHMDSFNILFQYINNHLHRIFGGFFSSSLAILHNRLSFVDECA